MWIFTTHGFFSAVQHKANPVTAGLAGYQFHRSQRYPGAHPLICGRFFALAVVALDADRRAGRERRHAAATGNGPPR